MLVNMYKHNKRINSTLLPKNEDLLISGNVTLKNATSVDEPIFIMACGANDMPKARICNYVECQGNYFWITELIQLSTTHIEVRCKIDVLTSYRKEIFETKAYVLYSDSAGRTDIVDNRNIRTINWHYNENAAVGNVGMFTGNGCFLIEVINAYSSIHISGSTFYLLSTEQMSNFVKCLYETVDFFDEIIRAIQNPSNLLINAIYYPFSLNHFKGNLTGSEESIYVGRFNVGASGFRITDYNPSQISELVKIDLSNLLINDYRYSENNCSIKCMLPFYGIIELNPATLLKDKLAFVRISLDIFTGTLMYEILENNGKSSYRSRSYKTKFGVTVPLGYQGYNPLPMIGSTAMAIGSIGAAVLAPEAIAPMAMAGALGNSAGAITNTISSLQKDNGVVGQLGSRVDYAWAKTITVTVATADLAESITAKKEVLGLPFCSTVELGTLKGFCQCSGASISAVAMPKELMEINNYLNGGVYIE